MLRISRCLGHALAICVLAAASPASATQILGVELDEAQAGRVLIGVRDGDGKPPTVLLDGVEIPTTVESVKPTRRWQPPFLVVDQKNVPDALLASIRENVVAISRRELQAGSQTVIVVDDTGARLEARKIESIETAAGQWKATPADPDTPVWSDLAPRLQGALSGSPIAYGAPWALVFSSMCVGPTDEAPDLSFFQGPITILTWNTDLNPKCIENRDLFVAKLREKKPVEVYRLDEPTEAAKAQAARNGRPEPKDEIVAVTGVPVSKDKLALVVKMSGVEDWKRTWTDKDIPGEWYNAAKLDEAAGIQRLAISGGLAILALVIVGAFLKARSSASEYNKWEAAGEAEEISSAVSAPVDPDAWNSTIFQLTGAMPVLKDIQHAAQIGPGPKDAEPATTPAPPTPAENAEVTGSAAAAEVDAASTGMTVNMPVYDDGTGYEAKTPFEVGVLHNGKPVARKTKKFRKVFSIGRATDNRVVVQKDDTVHRYHVVIRPAVEGKEWWLEVSPTATNRTNLNGKDLRAGGRYRLPDRFRLQLGEATEVRGRLSDS